MTNWIIGVLMGLWLALVLTAILGAMRSNARTQDACARLMASLERAQVSNMRVEAAYASWRSENILRQGRRASDADDELLSLCIDTQRARSGSAPGTTS